VIKSNTPESNSSFDKVAYQREYMRKRRAQHPIYNIWQGMIGRCCRPSDSAYPRYGARGIGVCERCSAGVAACKEMSILSGKRIERSEVGALASMRR
jgi:hypothetical protein